MTSKIQLTRNLVAIVDDADFEWLSRWNWFATPSGYAARVEKHRLVRMHRAILTPLPGLLVDHVNGDRLDNRRCNLRPATRAENARNHQKNYGGMSSRYRGVSWDKEAGRWITKIRVDYKRYFLGRFDHEVDAARAYDQAAKKYFGEFAQLNLPEERP